MFKKDHIEHTDDGPMCRYCGGIVGEDGFAPLGEAEELEPNENEETDQHAATTRMRDESGFADAVQRMSRGGYTKGVDLDDDESFVSVGTHKVKREDMTDEDWAKAQLAAKRVRPPEPEYTPLSEADELRRRKAARYGRRWTGERR